MSKSNMNKDKFDVKVIVLKSDPSIMVVKASGSNLDNIKNPVLVRKEYVNKPEDLVWDFYINGDNDKESRLSHSISVSNLWYDFPVDLNGVRIHGINGACKEIKYENFKVAVIND